jgi:hypothetical protein
MIHNSSGIGGSFDFKDLQDSVYLDVSKARELFSLQKRETAVSAEGIELEEITEEEKFIGFIRPLMSIAGDVNDKTDVVLDNFKTFLKFAEGKDIDGMVNVKFYQKTWFKVAVTIGVALLISATSATLAIFAAPALAAAVAAFTITIAKTALISVIPTIAIGISIFLNRKGGIKEIPSNIAKFYKTPPNLKITEINKFSKLGTVSALIKDGTIQDDKSFKTFNLKELRAALDSDQLCNQESMTFGLSQEEKIFILGEGMVERMDVLKEEMIKKASDMKACKDREPDEEKRKTLAAKEFKWTTAAIHKLIFKNNPMTQDFINSKEFENLSKSLLVVMFNDLKVEKNYDVIIERLRGIFIQDLANANDNKALVIGYIPGTQNIAIDKLINDEYFDQDNKLTQSSVKTRDEAIIEMKPIEAQITRRLDIPKAGTRLLGRMGENFTKPEEVQVALAKALCYFKSVGEMKNFLGLSPGEALPNKAGIAQAAFNTYKEALGKFTDGELAENEFKEVVELIRIVSDILMLIQSDDVTENIINDRSNNDYFNIINGKVNLRSTSVNARIFVDVFKGQEPIAGDKLFDIGKLKTALEKKDNNK